MLRRRLRVTGIVQGVGFRPFIYRIANQRGLSGMIRNQEDGVSIEVQGQTNQLDLLINELRVNHPPLARIERITIHPLPTISNEKGFHIRESENSGHRLITLAPDGYVCTECLKELWNPVDRRFLYPFINCTNCGPRYTITKDLPYDRSKTTMACFSMCSDCKREFSDPANRRYHAQPLACPICGPTTWLVTKESRTKKLLPYPDQHPVDAVFEARDLLYKGKVVAIKGIGGFLLAADAYNQEAVCKLRRLKNRKNKPMAVMVRNLEVAQKLIYFEFQLEELLRSTVVPIVIARSRVNTGLATSIAPGLSDLGVMLPSTPLHHLLFSEKLDALVMTSGNAPSEPMITGNREAIESLAADAFLLHNRDIMTATDDSVIRSGHSGPILIRRARGYVPESLDASFLPRCSVVALGAQLKVTVATLSRSRLVVGRHLGNLENIRSEQTFKQEIERMLHYARIEPEAIAVDLHPDLISSLYGEEIAKQNTLIRVQHHHAHMCTVLVEHGYPPDTQAIGIILDGMGYGPDGNIWGGEVIQGGYRSFERIGHLRYIPLPGGDRAAVEPTRMATSLLIDAGFNDSSIPGFRANIAQVCFHSSVTPLTSSTGRLFDGVAAILGIVKDAQSYEGEAASLLEAITDPKCQDAYELPLRDNELDTRSITHELMSDRSENSIRAARFQNGLADGFAKLALSQGSEIAVLSGGCIVNRILLKRLIMRLKMGGMVVRWPQKLPVGDGGISAGQAAVAACLVKY